MATYKVIQDIEAEDTIIGWMTPRQAIYAAIVIISGGLWFMFASAGAWWLGVILLPHMILFLVLAGPFVHDQPSEVWLLAKIKFYLQPRKRIWDQSGLKELVTITVPKKIERRLTDGLSQGEVKSRLHALADTLDSRGWAVKNISVNMYAQPGYAATGTDRLLGTDALPQEVPMSDVTAQDDILDERNNPRAQQLQQMISQSQQTHREQLVQQMQDARQRQASQIKQEPPADYWFMNANSGQQPQAAPGYATFQTPTIVNQASTPQQSPAVNQAEEQALLKKLRAEKSHAPKANSHLRTILPAAEREKIEKEKRQAAARQAPKPINQQLAQNNDRMVDSLARESKKLDDGEVVISLH